MKLFRRLIVTLAFAILIMLLHILEVTQTGYFLLIGASYVWMMGLVNLEQGLPKYRYGWNNSPAYLVVGSTTTIYLCNAFYDIKLNQYVYWGFTDNPDHVVTIPECFIKEIK